MRDSTWLRNVRVENDYLEKEGFTYGSKSETVDIEIKNGKISDIIAHQNFRPDGNNEIDGKNYLILPTLREMHCHLDKSKLGVPWKPITPANNIVERFTSEIDELDNLSLSLKERAKNLIETEISNGVTFFRSHIDVHPKVGQRYLEGVLETLEEYQGQLDYELVAFPQHGMLRSNAYDDVKKALESGVQIIGGVDPSSLDGDLERSLSQTFELAIQFNVPIDIHVHDRGEHGTETVKKLIEYTKQSNWQGKVAISHAFGLNDFVGEEREMVFSELAELGISVISSVPINGRIPPLEELRTAGVNVNLGCDNVYDSWSPFGTGNILEKLNRYAEIHRLTTQEALTDSLALITGKPFNLEKGKTWLKKDMDASFLLVDSSSAAEFVARQSPVKFSFYKGTVVHSL
ncbi:MULTISPECIES: amidohydrolase [unclassified Oceanobacillus]|uniref:amidohydrolase n=1 Tax=unclassified Oceanobacillus TaxID=2630292 RepID=UPI001BEBF3DE|nr:MULTISPECIES: amidohydrolase [unclassified Oceanobacillus]MBT2598994.1 amidohydrolase family protein [Oceanobacillus sp. ISL-74]MBT2651913.1 amidohydrolase family protein [Oceanobacillus sp. ISL-73]